MDPSVIALRDQIRAAASERARVRIRAGGSKDFYGNTPRGAVLDPRPVHGIVSYDPSELAIAARAGTPLTEVEAALDECGQMLAFEPPHFGPGATIGGCVASGLAGPRRAAYGYCYGGVRDFVLGAKLLDGQGQLVSCGGLVMKNVAGYDLPRLLTGSLGMLGIIVEVALKVVPKPRVEATLRLALDEAAALSSLNAWGAKPWPISASVWHRGVLSLRLSGATAAVAGALARLPASALPVAAPGATLDSVAAGSFWHGIKEHTDAFFAGTTPLWRLSLPSTAGPVALGEEQLIEWGGALRWIRSALPAAEIRARAQSLGGHATLFRGAERGGEAFTPLSPVLAAIHRRLRVHFDPAGIFDAGRMYPEEPV
jgi:glycolate oxidase FAD binding subunit